MNKNNLPTSIRENFNIDKLNGNLSPQAIVYLFEVIAPGHWLYGYKYIGSHLLRPNETIGDGQSYWTSATDERFTELLDAGVRMSYTILAAGSYEQMVAEEQRLQLKYDVIKNPKYFNKAVTGNVKRCHLSPYREVCKSLVKMIEKVSSTFKGRPLTDITPENIESEGLLLDDFEIVQMKTKDVVDLIWLKTKGDEKTKNDIRKIQVRLEENPDGLIQKIADEIKNHGDVTYTNFLVLIEFKGKWYLLDGNHTLKAIRKTKKTVCKVIKIHEAYLKDCKLSYTPKLKEKKLEERFDVFKYMGKLLNRKNKEQASPNSDEQVIRDIIADHVKYGYGFNTERNRKILYDLNYTKTKASKLCNTAEQRHRDEDELSKLDELVLNYTDKNSKQNADLEKRVAKQNEREDTYAMESSSSSGKSAFENITIKACKLKMSESSIHRFVWNVHHNMVSNKENWHGRPARAAYINDKGEKIAARPKKDGRKEYWREQIETVLIALGPVNINGKLIDRELVIVDDKTGDEFGILPYSGPKVVTEEEE